MLNVLDTTADESATAVKKITDLRPEETRRMRVWLDGKIREGKKHPISEIVSMTPVLAQLLLDHNPINRPISESNSASLRNDIAGKRFLFNGESLVVSDTGNLLDGQHRCDTVIGTGIAIQTVIVFGVKEEARYTIDIGKPKTVPNFLSMDGHKDTNNLAAAVGYVLQYRKYQKLYTGSVLRPTKTEILDAFEQLRDKGIEKSILRVANASKSRLGSRSILAFCHFMFKGRAGVDDADGFIDKILSGEGLRKGDPILACRNRLIAMERGAPAHDRAEIVIKSWNAHRRNETLTSVRVSGAKGSKLPKIEA